MRASFVLMFCVLSTAFGDGSDEEKGNSLRQDDLKRFVVKRYVDIESRLFKRHDSLNKGVGEEDDEREKTIKREEQIEKANDEKEEEDAENGEGDEVDDNKEDFLKESEENDERGKAQENESKGHMKDNNPESMNIGEPSQQHETKSSAKDPARIKKHVKHAHGTNIGHASAATTENYFPR